MIGPTSAAVHAFAEAVGASGPVCVEGGRTRWDVGGASTDTPIVRAPAGVLQLQPDEMTVTALAGTTLGELDDALRAHGQRVALDGAPESTIGGALAVGHGGIRRLGDGPPRDAVLQVSVVLADGRVTTCGGPTVKNVSGFDLCRLLVGSLGTLACIAEVILRTRPAAGSSVWFAVDADPALVSATVSRPTSHLWDGTTNWVLVEGVPAHVAESATALGRLGAAEVESPPDLPAYRWSRSPREAVALAAATTGAVAEIGVGIVHSPEPEVPRRVAPGVARLNAALLARFDPSRRLNPERRVPGRD